MSKNLCSNGSARVGSNALNALQGKAFSERSEDFSAAQRRESNGIFSQLVKKFLMR